MMISILGLVVEGRNPWLLSIFYDTGRDKIPLARLEIWIDKLIYSAKVLQAIPLPGMFIESLSLQ